MEAVGPIVKEMPSIDQRLAMRERPPTRPVMRQSWRELLFLHWKYDPAEIQKLLPHGLTIDTFDGAAWVGIVPFFMTGVRPVWCPPVPGLSNFLELNVRTYVSDSYGNPGVWFFSLDANNSIAVFVARTLFKLPYFHARMRARATPATVDYWSQRSALEADHFVYQPVGAERIAEPGTLEFFLVERYLLYTFDRSSNQLYAGRVHHKPYQIREVKVLEYGTQLLLPAGIELPSHTYDSALYSKAAEVDVFSLNILAIHS